MSESRPAETNIVAIAAGSVAVNVADIALTDAIDVTSILKSTTIELVEASTTLRRRGNIRNTGDCDRIGRNITESRDTSSKGMGEAKAVEKAVEKEEVREEEGGGEEARRRWRRREGEACTKARDGGGRRREGRREGRGEGETGRERRRQRRGGRDGEGGRRRETGMEGERETERDGEALCVHVWREKE